MDTLSVQGMLTDADLKQARLASHPVELLFR
jgi:hypothetical protein